MSKTEGMELKTLEHENKKQGFAAIYGVIDKRKYILEQETKIYQVEDVESDDAESVKSESSDICLSEEKKPVCEVAVEDYINYVMENRSELINCFNKREMKADVINFRLMAIDTPIPRNTLSMIGESEVALMLKIFGSSYSQGMVELDDIIIKNKNLFERMVLTRFLSQIRFWQFFVHPTFFWSFIESTTNIKENIYGKLSSKYGEYHYEVFRNVSFVF